MGIVNWFLNESTLQNKIYDIPTREDVDRFAKIFPSSVEKLNTLCEKALSFDHTDNAVLDILDELCDKIISINSQGEMIYWRDVSYYHTRDLVKENYKDLLLYRALLIKSGSSITYPYYETIFRDECGPIISIFSAMNSGEKFEKMLTVKDILDSVPIDIENYQLKDLMKGIITKDEKLIRRKHDSVFNLSSVAWYIQDIHDKFVPLDKPRYPSSVIGVNRLKTEIYNMIIDISDNTDYSSIICAVVNYVYISCFVWAYCVDAYQQSKFVYEIEKKALTEFLEECKKQ